MAEQAIPQTRSESEPVPLSATSPALGMRGGLGKTLLIAFLLLAIVPLSLLALFTNSQIQRDTRQKLFSSLETVVALKEAHVLGWVERHEHELALQSGNLAQEIGGPAEGSRRTLPEMLEDRLAVLQAIDPAVLALVLMDSSNGELIAATTAAGPGVEHLQPFVAEGRRLVVVPPGAVTEESQVAVGHAWAERLLVGLVSSTALQQLVADAEAATEGLDMHLVLRDGWVMSSHGLARVAPEASADLSEGIGQALVGESGSGAYMDENGVPVFGSYRWNEDLAVSFLAEVPEVQALATGNTLTAVIVGATLVVALITAAIAAAVTRQITRPIVQLTETAAWMARGQLNQQVSIGRTDEIGVLGRAFNRMAAELRTLYGNLEAKVAERTRQLEEANERVRYHAARLALSAEVARTATSIRDVDGLLNTVAELIWEAFELRHVSIFLVDDSGQWLVRRACSNLPALLPERVAVGDTGLVGAVAADGEQRVVTDRDSSNPDATSGNALALQSRATSEMGVPLRVKGRMLGVLAMQSDRVGDFDSGDQLVYRSLADQISVAIENARAYAVERETVMRLQELDRIQSRFLTNMSHALRTPLNSIIGFSRLMLKELDGPLTDLQRTDLDAIHHSGRQLLGLINDMLELSRLELGTAPFSVAEVDLAEIVEGVMATARALARGKPVQLYEEIPDDLPVVHTDALRVRQVTLALLANAVKFTEQGSIRLRITTDNVSVSISVTDWGASIPQTELAQLFSDAPYDETDDAHGVPGFGLAISRQVVARLGGQIWVENEEGEGSTFTFTLPIEPRVERQTL
jgi:signal transduction histidine kinase